MPGSGTERQHSFAMVPTANIQRSTFDRSHGLKTSFDFGALIPIFVDEALPGDTLALRMSTFGRMATMVHPIMENLYMDFFFFAVPNRLLWENWQKMMGEQDNPGDSTSFLVPQILTPGPGGFQENTLADYFGIPTKVDNMPQTSCPSALPFRAYNQIWNQWFRDENLQQSIQKIVNDGPEGIGNYSVQRRGKRHDYFTSALPFPQKGSSVSLPLGSVAPVVAAGTGIPLLEASSGSLGPQALVALGVSPFAVNMAADPTTAASASLKWATTSLQTNLATATAVTVNQLREAVAIQRLLERDARGGTRYTEILRSHFGVVSPDARLQRPEYLGGGSVRINVNPVASTFVSSQVPAVGLGTLGAFGTTSAQGVGFVKSFTEHCFVLGLVAARADLNYQQGLERMWSRRSRYDFYWPEFATLGEQPVKNKEIFLTPSSVPTTGVDEQTFGFQERYAEYRYKPSRVTGRLRSNSTSTLDSWHLAQNFSALPALNPAFIQENPDVARVLVATTGEPQLLLDAFFEYRCTRPMPTYSIPGLGGRL